MSSQAVKHRLHGWGLDDMRSWALLAVAGAWSAIAGAIVLGRLIAPVSPLGLLVGFPLLVVAGVGLSRAGMPPAARVALGWMAVLGGALFATLYLGVGSQLTYGLPLVFLAAWLLIRRPAVGVFGVFFLSGAYGSIEALTPLRPGPLVDVLLAGLWVGVLWSYLVKRREQRFWLWPGLAILGLYVFVSFIQALGGGALNGGLLAFRGTAWYVFAALLVAYAPWDRLTYERIAQGIVLIAFLVGGYATLRYIIGPAQAEQTHGFLAAGIYNHTPGDLNKLRLIGSFPSGHELSAWTAIAIPFCCAAALALRSRWRLVAAAAAVLLLIGLFGSEVRAGLAGVVVGVALVLLLYQGARGFTGLHLGATVVALVAVAGIGFATFATTVGGSSTKASRYDALLHPERDASYQERMPKWRKAMQGVQSHPWGNGIGSAGRVQRRYGKLENIGTITIDNSYLKIAFEQGVLAVFLFIAGAVAVLFGMARRGLALTDPLRCGLAIGACGSLASMLTIFVGNDYVEGLPALAGWLIVGLGVSQCVAPARPSRWLPRRDGAAESPGAP